MKQLLTFILALCTINAFSQTLTVVKRENTLVFSRSGAEPITVGAKEYFDVYRYGNGTSDTTSIIFTHARMNNFKYEKTNVLSVGGVSMAGKSATEIAWQIKNLWLSLEASSGGGGGGALPPNASTESTLLALSNKIGSGLDIGNVGLKAGTENIGKVGIDAADNTVTVGNPITGFATENSLTNLSDKFGSSKDIGDVGLKAGLNTIGNVNQTQATSGYTKITNGTLNVAVKGSGVSPLSTDNSMVMGLSPNGNTVKIGETIFIQSTGNSSTAQLGAGAIFTGTPQNLITGKSFIVSIVANQPLTINILQYIDAAGTQLVGTNTYSRVANAPFNESIQVNGNYVKVTVQNTGGVATTNLVIDSWFGDMPPFPSGVTNLGNFKVSLNEINGVIPSVNAGNADAGTKRVVIATNQTAFSVNSITPIPVNFTDVASAAITTTTTTAAITPTSGKSFQAQLIVTAVTGTSPVLNIDIEESIDLGVTWKKKGSFPKNITTAGTYFSPRLPLTGNRIRYVQTLTGTTPSFTRSITRVQSNDDVNLVYSTESDSQEGTITTGGTAQVFLPQNVLRQGFEIMNKSASDLYFSIGGTASLTVGFKLVSGGSYSSPATRTSTKPISIWGATTSQAFTFIEY